MSTTCTAYSILPSVLLATAVNAYLLPTLAIKHSRYIKHRGICVDDLWLLAAFLSQLWVYASPKQLVQKDKMELLWHQKSLLRDATVSM